MKIVLTHQVGGKQGVREFFESAPIGQIRIISLGRDPLSDLVLGAQDTKVSVNHAEIHLEENGFRIFDLQSTNGTYVNGGKITAAALHDGDLIEPRLFFAGSEQSAGCWTHAEDIEEVHRDSAAKD